MFKDSAVILDAIRRSFLNKSATATMFTLVLVELDGHLSRHILTDPFYLEIQNTTENIWSVQIPIPISLLHPY